MFWANLWPHLQLYLLSCEIGDIEVKIAALQQDNGFISHTNQQLAFKCNILLADDNVCIEIPKSLSTHVTPTPPKLHDKAQTNHPSHVTNGSTHKSTPGMSPFLSIFQVCVLEVGKHSNILVHLLVFVIFTVYSCKVSIFYRFFF